MSRRFTIRRLMLVIAAVALEFAVLPVPLAIAVACLTILVPLVPSENRWELASVVGIIGLLVVLLLPAIQTANGCRRHPCTNNLKQIALALYNYHDAYGCYPPAYVTDSTGKPVHSWRILILPYLEQQRLYNSYDFSEPWDGPNNIKLAAQMPRIFACDGVTTNGKGLTSYLAITGEGTAFPGAGSTKMADILDGT